MPSLFQSTTNLINNYILAKGDSGASHHYAQPEDSVFLHNLQPYHGPSVTLPDNDTLPPSHQGHLPLSKNLQN